MSGGGGWCQHGAYFKGPDRDAIDPATGAVVGYCSGCICTSGGVGLRAKAVIPVVTDVLPDDVLENSVGKRIPSSFLAAQVKGAVLTKVTRDVAGRPVMHLMLEQSVGVSLIDGEDEL